VIGNEVAARILLAFDLEQPWACHQTYRLFDELHSPIFARPEVNAKRIRALYEAYEAVVQAMPTLKHELMAGYRLTRYFLLYVLKAALRTTDVGSSFVKLPQDFVKSSADMARLRRSLDLVLGDLIVDTNAELNERDSARKPIDFKRELKSPTAVRQLAQQIVPMYEKAVKRGRVRSFADEWTA